MLFSSHHFLQLENFLIHKQQLWRHFFLMGIFNHYMYKSEVCSIHPQFCESLLYKKNVSVNKRRCKQKQHIHRNIIHVLCIAFTAWIWNQTIQLKRVLYFSKVYLSYRHSTFSLQRKEEPWKPWRKSLFSAEDAVANDALFYNIWNSGMSMIPRYQLHQQVHLISVNNTHDYCNTPSSILDSFQTHSFFFHSSLPFPLPVRS